MSDSPTIYTIGHSTRSIDNLIAILKAHGVKAVADVRQFPRSRRFPHFNDDALAESLPRFGIEGAAIASLIGYSVMLCAALFGLIQRRQLGFWHYLRPQVRDIDYARLKAMAAFSMLTRSES